MPAALPPAWGLYFLPLDSVALSFPGRISTAVFSMAHALILANFPLHPPRIQVHVGRSEVTRKCIQNARNCNWKRIRSQPIDIRLQRIAKMERQKSHDHGGFQGVLCLHSIG